LTLPAIIKRPGGLLLGAVLLGLFLRCFGVESHELQYDEAATGYFAALPWSDLWGPPALLEPNPPLFYSLAWLVTRAGGSVEQLRYLSVIAGVLCIPLAWLIARHLAGDFAAASAALLTAVSPQHIAISQYARAYALLILCFMIAFLCLLRLRHLAFVQTPVSRADRGWWWSGYAIAGAASLYTHHTAAIVLTALNLPLLLSLVRTRFAAWPFFKEWLAANFVITGLYAPWLPVLAHQALPEGAISFARTVPAANPLQRLWTIIQKPFTFSGLPWIDIRLLPLAMFGVWRLRLSKDMVFFATLVLGGFGLMIVISQWHPLLDGKTLAWAGLLTAVAAATGLSAAGRFRLPLLVLVILLQLPAGITALYPLPEGWREAARLFGQMARPNDTVYVNYMAAVLPLRHYGWPESEVNIKALAKGIEEPWFRGQDFPVGAPGAAGRQASQEKRVWLLTYGPSPQSAQMAKEIETRLARVLHWRTEKLDLSLFSSNAP
jgi:hypothetical protein